MFPPLDAFTLTFCLAVVALAFLLSVGWSLGAFVVSALLAAVRRPHT